VDATTPLLAFENVSKLYTDGNREILALDRVSFEVHAGTFVAIYGARQSGKSTLVRLMAGIEAPTTGTVRFEGRDVASMSSTDRSQILRSRVAFVSPQDWSSSPGQRVVDHVILASASKGLNLREARRRALPMLAEVGLGDRAEEPASLLSPPERMRVMLAQALIREPSLLLLDEPAVFPSPAEKDAFLAWLRALVEERQMTLVVASVDMRALQGATELMSIADGELISTAKQATIVAFPSRRGTTGTPPTDDSPNDEDA
jgi:putative ABC transport system ATP-binding protein